MKNEKNPRQVSGQELGGVFPDVTDEDRYQTIMAWLNKELDQDAADELEQEITYGRGPWRDAYNYVLSANPSNLSEPRVLRYHRPRREESLALALDHHEIKQAKSFSGNVFCLYIPHEGTDAFIEAVVTPEGLLFHVRGHWNSREDRRLCPFGTKVFHWRDRVLDITIHLEEMDELRPIWRAQKAISQLECLAYGTGHSRAIEHAVNVTEMMQSIWVDILSSAAHAFENALEVPEELEGNVRTLIAGRVALDRLSRRLCDGYLDLCIQEADEALAPHKAGLLLIESDWYSEYFDGERMSSEGWWMYPVRLDREVPLHMVCEALEELAEKEGYR